MVKIIIIIIIIINQPLLGYVLPLPCYLFVLKGALDLFDI